MHVYSYYKYTYSLLGFICTVHSTRSLLAGVMHILSCDIEVCRRVLSCQIQEF